MSPRKLKITGTQPRSIRVMKRAQAGFIARVGKGPEKQENGGKQGGKSRDKGKMHSDSNPSVVSRDVLEDTAIGVGELAHKEAQCWFNQEYTKSNPPTRPVAKDIREWTKSAEKGQGHNPAQREKEREKEKAQEKSREKGTTTKTRLDLRTRKLDSAS